MYPRHKWNITTTYKESMPNTLTSLDLEDVRDLPGAIELLHTYGAINVSELKETLRKLEEQDTKTKQAQALAEQAKIETERSRARRFVLVYATIGNVDCKASTNEGVEFADGRVVMDKAGRFARSAMSMKVLTNEYAAQGYACHVEYIDEATK